MKQPFYPYTPPMFEEDLKDAELMLEPEEISCLKCGLREVGTWPDQGPEAPPLPQAVEQRLQQRRRGYWLNNSYRLAAALAFLVLFVHLGTKDRAQDSRSQQESHYFLLDSARNDTAFHLQKDNQAEDSVAAVSQFSSDEQPASSGQLSCPLPQSRVHRAAPPITIVSLPRSPRSRRALNGDPDGTPLASNWQEPLPASEPLALVRKAQLS